MNIPSEPVRLGIVADVRNQYFREIVSGIVTQARRIGGVRFEYIESSFSQVTAYKVPLRLSGVLAQPLEPQEYRFLRRRGIAVVNFSARKQFEDYPRWVAHVVSDDRAVGELAARHFASMGLPNLGFFGCDTLHYSTGREAGFREALGQATGGRTPRYFAWRHGVHAKGGAAEWLAQLPRPIGVFAAQDHYARTLSLAAVQAGWRIPDDLAILGVDADTVLSELSPVRLSSIRPDAARIGARALEIMLDLILRPDRPPMGVERIPPLGIHFDESAPRFYAGDPQVARALRWLGDHMKSNVGIGTLAEAVGMSRRSLEYAFKTRLGVGPYQKLLEMRLTRARELLEETSLPIIAVAEEAGFSDQREFCVRFRAKVGLTPTAYRLQAGHGG